MVKMIFQFCTTILFFAFVGISVSLAQEPSCNTPQDLIGKVVSVGDTSTAVAGSIFRNNSTSPTPLAISSGICKGDKIVVNNDSRVGLYLFLPKTFARLDSNSIFYINSPNIPESKISGKKAEALFVSASPGQACFDTIQEVAKKAWMYLEEGALHIFTTQPQTFNINTPHMNASVEGTGFSFKVDQTQSDVTVFQGRVNVCDNLGEKSETLESGETITTEKGRALQEKRIVVDLANAVKWAIYYPDLNIKNAPAMATRAYRLLRKGRMEVALGILGDFPKDAYSNAIRLIALLSQNKLKNANEYYETHFKDNYDDEIPINILAKSYLEQANFRLPAALATVENSSYHKDKTNDDNAYLLMRIAELKLALEDRNGSVVAARDAVTVKKDLGHAHTILGFALLAKLDIKQAKKAFETGRDLDNSDPLPRLGLGLIEMRGGNVASVIEHKNGFENFEEGAKEHLEIAVGLDPANSLVRSYLGKIYTELGNFSEATRHFALAERFDIEDPTPNLYRAISYATNNLPLAALLDLEKSILKNNNRAVYRSALGLDEDLAVRSASLGRIYDELGFDQLTLSEGAKSLSHDPSNYSAHRLMADAYINKPRHEIARVSELLQSQIRQPLNNNPAQAQLTDSRLGNFQDIGPANSSYNEFTRLFSRNGTTINSELLVGDNDTTGAEALVSGLHNNTSFNVSGYLFKTDGHRLNADRDNKFVSGFVQHRLSDSTSIQLEHRDISLKSGETFVGFDRQDFDPNFRASREINSTRLGVHYEISPNQEIMLSYRKETLDLEFLNLDFGSPDFEITRTANVDSDQFEIQHVIQQSEFKFISGIGNVKQDRKDDDFAPSEIILDSEEVIKHKNAYGYAYLGFGDLNVSIGASYDDFTADIADTEQVSPKLGLVYLPNPGTTIRVAAFETFKRTLVADQTLEPTNIAGFNQFYDDPDSAETKVYGLGIDQKIYLGNGRNNALFFGVELSEREINVPIFVYDVEIDDFVLVRDDIGERFTKAYIYYPGTNWAFGATYENEIFDRKFLIEGPEQIVDLDTKSIKFNITYIHNERSRFSILPTYIKQKGDFITRFFEEFSGEDEFWVVDAVARFYSKKRATNGASKIIVSLEAKNIFDKDFSFQDSDPFNTRHLNSSALNLSATINFN